jgi:hypothetical protein
MSDHVILATFDGDLQRAATEGYAIKGYCETL